MRRSRLLPALLVGGVGAAALLVGPPLPGGALPAGALPAGALTGPAAAATTAATTAAATASDSPLTPPAPGGSRLLVAERPPATGPSGTSRDRQRPPEETAREFLGTHAGSLGVRRPGEELRAERILPAGPGRSVVRYRQLRAGLPVVGGQVVVAVQDGAVRTVNAETTAAPAATPGTPPGTSAATSSAEARRRALISVARAHRVPVADLSAAEPTRWFYDPALLGAPDPLGGREVWRVEVSTRAASGHVRDVVLVDARTGGMALRYAENPHAAPAQLCDLGDRQVSDAELRCADGHTDHDEARPPGAETAPEVSQAWANLGATYDFYAGLGRLGVDGRDAGVRATVRVGGLCDASGSCERFLNAYWDPRVQQAVFGTGLAGADDVVAHELTHGVIEHTADLIYAFESGAINESLADVMGELVDLRTPDRGRRWQLGEDSSIGALRDMSDPTASPAGAQPDRITSPRWLAHDPWFADSGGVHVNSGVGNKAAALIVDGGSFNGRTVAGVGPVKAARIYYTTLQLLTEGSNYADLARVLPQACQDVLGTDGITEADCSSVRAAVAATEMALRPRERGAAEPRCPVGVTARRAAGYDFETPHPELRADGSGTRLEGWYQLPDPDRGLGFAYPHRGKGSAWAFEAHDGVPSDRSLTLSAPVRVPAGRSTYVRFAHLHALAASAPAGSTPEYYASGRVEYSVGGGAWTDAGRLFTTNGYSAQVDPDGSGPAPAAKAFGATSPGWIVSRLDLSPLAGTDGADVRLRFRLAGDGVEQYFGWVLDDLEVYGCDAPAAPAPTRVRVRGSGAGSATVTWTPPAGAVASYSVTGRPAGDATGKVVSAVATGTATSLRLRGLTTGVAYDVVVTARTKAGSGAAAPVRTVRARLTSSAPAGPVAAGTTVRIKGTLSRDDGRAASKLRVRVDRRLPGSSTWAALTTATTSATGGVSVPVRVGRTYEYRLVHAGSSGLLWVRSPARTLVVRR